jgi:hypothetical protein
MVSKPMTWSQVVAVGSGLRAKVAVWSQSGARQQAATLVQGR